MRLRLAMTSAVSWKRIAMLPFKLIYSDEYYLPIGEHVFPAEKYRRVHDRLLADGCCGANDFLQPNPPPIKTFCWSTRRSMFTS